MGLALGGAARTGEGCAVPALGAFAVLVEFLHQETPLAVGAGFHGARQGKGGYGALAVRGKLARALVNATPQAQVGTLADAMARGAHRELVAAPGVGCVAPQATRLLHAGGWVVRTHPAALGSLAVFCYAYVIKQHVIVYYTNSFATRV